MYRKNAIINIYIYNVIIVRVVIKVAGIKNNSNNSNNNRWFCYKMLCTIIQWMQISLSIAHLASDWTIEIDIITALPWRNRSLSVLLTCYQLKHGDRC